MYEAQGAEEERPFEIVYVSSDKNQAEFDKSTSTMPWLVIPYEDVRLPALRKYFDIRGIPAVYVINGKGKLISTNGRSELLEHYEHILKYYEELQETQTT